MELVSKKVVMEVLCVDLGVLRLYVEIITIEHTEVQQLFHFHVKQFALELVSLVLYVIELEHWHLFGDLGENARV